MYKLDDPKLKEAQWIFSHRGTLHKVIYGSLILISAVIWIIVIIHVVLYIIGYASAQRAYDQMGALNVNYAAQAKPQALNVIDKAILSIAEEKYQAYAIVENPNSKFSGKFSYTFTVGSTTYDFSETTIMPGEQLFLVVNDVKLEQANVAVELTPTQVQWQRVRGNNVPPQFKLEQTTLTAVNLTKPPDTTNNSDQPVELNTTNSNSGGGVPYTKFEATVTNQSVVGFHAVQVVVVVKNSAGKILAIGTQTVKDIDSFARFKSIVYWPIRFLSDVQPEVYFYTDYLDRYNLIYPGE